MKPLNARKLVIIVLVLGVHGALAQKRAKYGEALPVMLSLPPSGAIAQLKTYLPEEVDNPSIYLQMAVIYEGRFRTGDPMKDYDFKIGNAKLAVESYDKTLQFIDDKSVKRSQEEYFNFGSYDEKGRLSVNYDSVLTRITRSKADLQKFIEFAPVIYESFTQSFSHYDQAHKIFTEIVGTYPTFKEFYLLYGPDVDAKMESLKDHYLKFDEAFRKYKEALANYSTGYNQSLTVKEIHTYRLEGLEAQINFLKNDLQVWNYAKWVDETRQQVKAEIGALRASLQQENTRLDQRLGTVSQEFVSDEFEPLKASKEVLFNLRKYDLSSVVEPLFIYKERKHDLLKQELLSQSLDTSTIVDTDRKLYLLGQMINKIKDADTVLSDVQRRNTNECLRRYPDFLNKNYKGITGINAYVKTELEVNQRDFDHYVDQIKTELYKKLADEVSADVVIYKKIKIPLTESPQPIYDSIPDGVVTTRILKNFDGSMFVSGVSKNTKEKLIQSFVCGVTPDKKIAWYNEYLLTSDSASGRKADTRIATLQTIPGGLAMVLNGVDTTTTRLNLLMVLDEKGTSTLSRRLLFDQFPRTMMFSQRDNSILLTLKGDNFTEDIYHETELLVGSFTVLGDLKWQTRISYKGDVAGVVEVDQGYLVVGNYNLMKDKDGKYQRGGKSSEETSVFVQKLDQSGSQTDLMLVSSTASLVVNKIYRIGDECINLFGARSVYFSDTRLITDPEVSLHIIVNKDLEVLAKSVP